ncbi:MAG TPA: helix-turn-helix domain-containing protein [Puia sp.]|jgi:AraC family transcriptional activator of pobA|nr:helix-turn-helix domain-containing protein [Puia sp.]
MNPQELLSPVKTKKKSDFEIQTIDSMEGSWIETKTGVHINSYYEIIWITSGSANLQIDFNNNVINNNHLYFIRPGQAHWFVPGENLKGYVIQFHESFFDLDDQQTDPTHYRFLFQLFGQSKAIDTSGLTGELQETMERMLCEFNSSFSFRMDILKRYFKIFLIYLTRHLEESFTEVKQTRNLELVNQFMYLVDKKFKSQKMVVEYAGELSVSPNYLNEITKKLTGFSAGHHIRRRVILEAKRLGRYSDHCMKEIAYHLGFSDSAHFSKFFKTVSGTNFTEFKNQKVVFSLAE